MPNRSERDVTVMVQDTDAPWRDEGTLRQKYWVEEKSLTEVAEELGCSKTTVRKWLLKTGLGVRDNPSDKDAKYRDPELLRRLYWDERLSTIDIAERLDCSKHTVQKYMKRNGIETRQSYRDKNGCFFTNKQGYEQFAVTQNYETDNVRIHRLVAVAEGDLAPSDFCDEDIQVHHNNRVPWDNRPENIDVLSVEEHAKHHVPERERNEYGDFI